MHQTWKKSLHFGDNLDSITLELNIKVGLELWEDEISSRLFNSNNFEFCHIRGLGEVCTLLSVILV